MKKGFFFHFIRASFALLCLSMMPACASAQFDRMGEDLDLAPPIPVFSYFDDSINTTVTFVAFASTPPIFCARSKSTTPGVLSSVECRSGNDSLAQLSSKYSGFCHFYNQHKPFLALPSALQQSAFDVFIRDCFEVSCDEYVCNDHACILDTKAQRECHKDAHMLRFMMLRLMLETDGVELKESLYGRLQQKIRAVANNFYNGMSNVYPPLLTKLHRRAAVIYALNTSDSGILEMYERDHAAIMQEQEVAEQLFHFAYGRMCYELNQMYQPVLESPDEEGLGGWCPLNAPPFDPSNPSPFLAP